MYREGGMALDDRTSTIGRWRWVLWLVCLAVWTIALLRPEPARFNNAHIAPLLAGWPISKFLHVGMYAFLTAFAGTLLTGRLRWLLLAVLSFHAIITEVLQNYVPERSGTPFDVGLNHLGIALGLAIGWRWWFSR
jgi:hypothetical protein